MNTKCRRWQMLLVGLLLMAACKSSGTTPSEVIVEIDAEPGVRAQTASLHVVVQGMTGLDDLQGQVKRLDEEVPKQVTFPKRIALVPLRGDDARAFSLTVTALDSRRQFVAEARMISGYVPADVRYARILLEDACIGTSCEDISTTCMRAKCVSAQVDPQQLSRDTDNPKLVTSPESSDAGAQAQNAGSGGSNAAVGGAAGSSGRTGGAGGDNAGTTGASGGAGGAGSGSGSGGVGAGGNGGSGTGDAGADGGSGTGASGNGGSGTGGAGAASGSGTGGAGDSGSGTAGASGNGGSGAGGAGDSGSGTAGAGAAGGSGTGGFSGSGIAGATAMAGTLSVAGGGSD